MNSKLKKKSTSTYCREKKTHTLKLEKKKTRAMQTFAIDQPNKRRAGIFVPKRLAILGVTLACLTITGVILVTYFAKPDKECTLCEASIDETSSTARPITVPIPPTTQAPPVTSISS
jgi:hypothetical protein